MSNLNSKQEVVERKDGFNDVNAWVTPNGELVIVLSHRNTNDADVLVRVRTDDDVIVVDREPSDAEHGEWEMPGSRLERLNTGGNWE